MSDKRLHSTANLMRKNLDPATSKIQHIGDAKEQTLAAFAEGMKAVDALGGSLEDVIRVRMFVKSHADTRSVGEALKETFGDVGVAATMVVCSFVDPEMLVEIEMDAVSGKGFDRYHFFRLCAKEVDEASLLARLTYSMQALDVVWAIHEFEAENPDEISFKIGEKVVVYEKDDQYQDGWWQGENEAGERGLFPKVYTSKEPPSAPASPVQPAQSIPLPGESHANAVHPTEQGEASRPQQLDTEERQSPAAKTTTIDDVQNHLEKMYAGDEPSTSAAVPGVLPPAIENEVMIPPAPAVKEQALVPEPAAALQEPTSVKEDDASLASHSIRDDSSSILSKEIEEDERSATGNAMASHAKENLARNVQMAQERAEKKRVAEERAREAERERLRLGAPPVEGLLLSDESDAEDDEVVESDDNDSIFPARRVAGSPDNARPKDEQAIEASSMARVPTVQAASVIPLPQSPEMAQPNLTSFAARASTPTDQLSTQPQLYLVNDGQNSPYTGPSSSVSSIYRPTPQATPLREDSEVLSDSPKSTTPEFPAREVTPVPSLQDSFTPRPAANAALPQISTAPFPASTSTYQDSTRPEQRGVVEQPSARQTDVPKSSRTGPRKSIDAGVAPGQDGLMSLVEQANGDQNNASFPASPRQSSTEPSSRTNSILGTAFTPATSATYEQSPRSATFGSKRTPSDPREWTVDQVVEWGQSKNFDNSILSKFREHEISGDVLVDMDVNTLKEIDILAFGPRARIAKAIKDLRSTFELPSSARQSDFDSSSVRASSSTQGGSIRDERFSPNLVPMTPEAPATIQEEKSIQEATPQASNEPLTGLGLEEKPVRQKPIRSPSVMRSIQQLTGIGKSSAPPQPASPKTNRTRETTGGTDDSFDTAHEAVEELQEPTATVQDNATETTATTAASAAAPKARHSRQASQTVSVSDKEKRGFFGNTFPRNRKPPPRYPSVTDLDKVAAEPRPGPRTSTGSNRLSTRLFGMGGSSPTASPSSRDLAKSSISAPIQAQTPTSPSATFSSQATPSSPLQSASPRAASVPTSPRNATFGDLATPAETGANVTSAQRIGEPDFSGYLKKRGERYNTWKERYLILKGIHLYILKSPTEQKIKGWINLSGYKFVSDGSVGGMGDRNKYAFKAIHDTSPTHYFSSQDSVITRNWMKALMKATIGRDYTAPVTSSANLKTIPLSVAQAMNPPPRPPSPTSARNVQKASLQQNPKTLSVYDAAKLMGAAIVPNPSSSSMRKSTSSRNGSKTLSANLSGDEHLSPNNSPERRKNSLVGLIPPIPLRAKTSRKKPAPADDSTVETLSPPRNHESPDITPRASTAYESDYRGVQADSPTLPNPPQFQRQSTALQKLVPQQDSAESQELLEWINDHLPSGTPKAFEWNDMSSGKLYTRLVENLSGRSSNIPDAEFDKFTPAQPGRPPNMNYIDTLFKCFDFLLDCRIDTADVSINDLMTTNRPHMQKLAEIIRMRFES